MNRARCRNGRLWEHNGSIVRLLAEGDKRRFLYEQPRASLKSIDVSKGTLLFSGRRVGNQYTGTAYVFQLGCSPAAYSVSGPVISEEEVVLSGNAPVRDPRTCKVLKSESDVPKSELRFLFRREQVAQAPSNMPSEPPKPQVSDEVRKVAIGEAKDLLDDVQTFLKAKGRLERVAEIAAIATKLNGAVTGDNYVVAKEEAPRLQNLMSEIQGFDDFHKDLIERRAQNRKLALDQAKSLAIKNIAFLDVEIAQNLMGRDTEEILKVREKASDALKKIESKVPTLSLDILAKSNTDFATFVERRNLADSYRRYLAEAATPDVALGPFIPKHQPGDFRATERNKFILNGSSRDLVILYNSSPTSPHIRKNLDGNFDFDPKRAVACSLQRQVDLTVPAILTETKRVSTGEIIELQSAPCRVEQWSQYDLISFKRDEFFTLEKKLIESLLQRVERTDLSEFAVISGEAIDQLINDRAEQANKNKNGFASGELVDFGLLVVGENPKNGCAIDVDDVETHREFIARNYEKIFFQARADFTLQSMSANTAFWGVQQRKCDFIYGIGSELSKFFAALRREERAYEVAPITFVRKDIDAEIADKARRKKIAAEQKLKEDQKSRDDRQKKQMALRKENADRANGLKAILTEEATAILQQKSTDGTRFPRLLWAVGMRRYDRWDLAAMTSEIIDFGIGEWGGRRLETALVEIKSRERNRIRGEEKIYCQRIGIVLDSDYQMKREPIEGSCDDDAVSILRWEKRLHFESRWNAQ